MLSLRLGCGTWSPAEESRGGQEASRGRGRGTGQEPREQPPWGRAGAGASEGPPSPSRAQPHPWVTLGDATHPPPHVSCSHPWDGVSSKAFMCIN